MEFNLEQIDTVLSTTRAVRRRLDFDRGVPDEVSCAVLISPSKPPQAATSRAAGGW